MGMVRRVAYTKLTIAPRYNSHAISHWHSRGYSTTLLLKLWPPCCCHFRPIRMDPPFYLFSSFLFLFCLVNFVLIFFFCFFFTIWPCAVVRTREGNVLARSSIHSLKKRRIKTKTNKRTILLLRQQFFYFNSTYKTTIFRLPLLPIGNKGNCTVWARCIV